MRASILVCLVVLASCARERVDSPDITVIPERAKPTVVARTKLTVDATGVSVDASGQRYLWASGVGLQRLTPDGPVVEFDAKWMGANARTRFEDLAIIDSRRVALIAENEGLIVDRTTGQTLSSFCYLPGFMAEQDPSARQFSRALAYDPKEDRLYVQPQTFTGFGDTVTGSQIGLFDPAISEPLEWQTIGERTFIAGGMTVASRERTYLGMGTRLYQYDARAEGSFQNWWDLQGVVQSIEGLALDRTTNTMLVIDGTTHELVEIKVDGLQ